MTAFLIGLILHLPTGQTPQVEIAYGHASVFVSDGSATVWIEGEE